MAIVSKVDICNSALAKVGGARISSLDDDSQEARLCKELYSRLSIELIRAHPWNFAIERIALGQLSDVPLYGYSYQFRLPSDCLRVLNINHEYHDSGGKFVEWKVEGRVLLANDTPIKIRFIKDVSENPQIFDTNFSEALATRIAADLAYPLTNSNRLAERMFDTFNRILMNARTYDAQEGSSDRISADTWLDARY